MWLRVVLVLVIGVACAAGLLARIWYLAHDPLDADEAVAGLMARHFAAGHANAFFWGQRYGGVETYLVAAAFWLAGSSTLVLRTVPVFLNAVSCVLVWRVGVHLTRWRWLAVLGAVAMWAVPQVAVWNSTLEYGFRGVTMVCGLAMVLFSVRAVTRVRPSADLIGLGAAAGIGWWSSPEIVYFALPSAMWVAGWAWRMRSELRAQAGAVAMWGVGAVVVACMGALPWLWDNVGSGFPSLNTASYYVPATAPHYVGRLSIFVVDAWPMLLDLRVPSSGSLRVSAQTAIVVGSLAAALVVVAGIWCVLFARRAIPLVAAVAAYPLLVSIIPGSWIWESGRYTVFLVPLVLLVVIAAADTFADLRRAPRGTLRVRVIGVGAAAMLLVAVVSTGAEASRFHAVLSPPGVHLGSAPNAPALRLARALDARGLTEGYADYWVAYKLDFLAGGSLRYVPAPPSQIRTLGMLREVEAAPPRRQVWLFVSPTPSARAEYVNSPVIQGPGSLPEPAFLHDLVNLGTGYRVVHLGGVDAVIPDRRVTFSQVGLHPFATGK